MGSQGKVLDHRATVIRERGDARGPDILDVSLGWVMRAGRCQQSGVRLASANSGTWLLVAKDYRGHGSA